MDETPDLDARVEELAERCYRYLEDQLYDPDPGIDGYDKEEQRQDVLEVLKDLFRELVREASGHA
jgi:hypothetical protein